MRYNLLNNLAVGAAQAIAAVTIQPIKLPDAPRALVVQASFSYGAGGTAVDAYLQTSLDGGTTWVDIAQFHFTTTTARAVFNLSSLTPVTTQYAPTDGSLASNTAKDGILGQMFQVKLASTGTYTGATALSIDINPGEH